MADAEAEALRKQRAADEKADRDAATRMVIDELKISLHFLILISYRQSYAPPAKSFQLRSATKFNHSRQIP